MTEFRARDRVALKDDFLKAKEEDISCVRIIKAGFPNEFTVSKILSVEEDGSQALVLSPCCGRLKNQAGGLMCEAHPAGLFRLVLREAEEPTLAEKAIDAIFSGDPKRFVSVELPGLGNLLHFAHYDDGKEEGLTLKIAGMKPARIAGRDLQSLLALIEKLKPKAR
jgi:hypothetical protein